MDDDKRLGERITKDGDSKFAAGIDRGSNSFRAGSSDIEMPIHGGDIALFEQRYGTVPTWIDFSANINPLGPPKSVLQALQRCVSDVNTLIEYPTRRERHLREVLAQYHRMTAEHIVIANGAAALIEAFIRTIAPRNCVIPQPAFSEYHRALQAQGTQLIAYPLDALRDFCLQQAEFCAFLQQVRPAACILTNPHNPSGVLIAPQTMRAIIDICRDYQIALLVDEAFIDYIPEASVIAALEPDVWSAHCVILRSVTKFFAMPGLRVGYAIASIGLAARLAARIPSWPITACAIDATIVALADQAYADTTRAVNIDSRTAFVSSLQQLGLRVTPSVANFLLIGGLWDSQHCSDWLARQYHIAVRDCTSYGIDGTLSYIRVAVRSIKDNQRFIQGIQAYLAHLS